MTYIVPQVILRQLFAQSPAAQRRKQLACIIGGHAALYRYSESDEKPLIALGQYDHVGTNIGGTYKTDYSWPEKPTGSTVDQDYTKLFIDSATLRYYLDTSETAIKTASNKVRMPTVAFADNPLNPTGYPKSAIMKDRGAKVGDVVIIRAKTAGAEERELCTYIKAFEGDAVASVIATAEAVSTNQVTAIAAQNATRDADSTDNVDITAVGTAYSGYADGYVSETYTIEVIQAGTSTDFTTAILKITSASGTDDVATKAPSATGVATAIGTRGLTVTFEEDQGANFALGDKWTVTVNEVWTATAPTKGGTYTGDKARTYVVEVTKGGLAGTNDPEVTVTSSDGGDFSGPTIVTAVDTAFAVGSYGVTMELDTAKLRKGDRFSVAVTPATTGLLKTLVLGHSLASDVPLNDAATADIHIELYIKANIEVGRKHLVNAGDYNWTQSATQLSVNADIYAEHSEWTVDDVVTALPVITDSLCAAYNKLYVEVRYWRSDLATSRVSFATLSELNAVISGPITPDNPLKYGGFLALANANGQYVYAIGVSDPADVDSWTTSLGVLERYRDTYGIAPMTYDGDALLAVQAHIESMSGETAKKFRTGWFGAQAAPTKEIVNATLSSDEGIVLATTEDDPDTSGTQYTILTITSGNADLETMGVVAGDIVRYKFTSDAWGDESYTEYVIDAVLSEDTIRLATGTVSEEATPIRVEIYRQLAKTQQAIEIGLAAAAWGDRRISVVYPDTFTATGGDTVPGYFAAAALAALAGGVPPHQGLTRVAVSGISAVPRTVEYFSESQLDEMASRGVHIITQNEETGEIYSRHAVTTGDQDNLQEREEMARRNADSISFRFIDQFDPYIGKSNATPELLNVLDAEARAVIQELRVPFSPELGGQLIDAEILDLRISPTAADTVILAISCDQPSPFNVLDLTLLFS